MDTTSLREMVEKAKDLITVRQVFGDPIERNGITIIPAAKVVGGGGGGGGTSDGGEGNGGGLGVASRPSGAFVIRGDQVEWQPAIDVGRVVTSVAAVLIAFIVFRRRKKSA